MSHQTAARFNLFVFGAFSSFQTKGMSSEEPGTLAMHPFCVDKSINLYFFM